MPYIDKMKRDMLEELVRTLREYPTWRDTDNHSRVVDMVKLWLSVLTSHESDPNKIDGYLNFMFTIWLKYTHQTYSMKERKKQLNNFGIESATEFIREMMEYTFEGNGFKKDTAFRSYSKYERAIGLLNCMEGEFERRGWSIGRKDLKGWFIIEKRHWMKKLAEYEDEKIKENGDV